MSEIAERVFSIGHSTLSYEQFLALLRRAGVTAVADVRSSPYSRLFPQYNSEALKEELKRDGVAYVFLGNELGGRPRGAEFYCEGVADYEKMATTEGFANGVARVLAGAEKYRIALMCSEKHPLDCHRCLLVGRELLRRGVDTRHILSDGEIAPQSKIESELLTQFGYDADDLFSPLHERLAAAYRLRAKKVAFADPSAANVAPVQEAAAWPR